jgi:penicillin-binding protein 1A
MVPKKWWQFLLLFIVVSGLAIAALGTLAALVIYPTLPDLDALTDYRPKLPLKVYSSDGFLIGEFGEERRAFIKIDQVPKNLKDAVLAIEDRRFYQHGGIDTTGIARAIKNNITGKSHEGASTITMQVAKNFFSNPGDKRTLVTKIKEALLAVKIEKALHKDQILELYLNQIYLGQRSYGFAAASQVYYGKPLEDLTLAECALLAGLPKAPSNYNPFLNPKASLARQNEVLRDMYRFGFIEEAVYNEAKAQKLVFKTAGKQEHDLSADYVAEIVRQTLFDTYHEAIYSSGLKVYTTIKKPNQEAANSAVLQGILEYQRREGYQKPEKFVDLSQLNADNFEEGLKLGLADVETYNGFVPAIVTEASSKLVKVYTKKGEVLEITGSGLSVIQRNLSDKTASARKIKPGSVVRLIKSKANWSIVQLPEVESALVALDPEDGAVTALVGGFDFTKNKFNHVTQAWRQPGSSFKPFVYSAALEKGFTASSVVDDAPLNLSASEVGSGESWKPENFDKHYSGPIRLRTALTKSKNMVSIRVLKKIGPQYAQDYITKFGFSRKDNPAYLAMALGAGSATPWGMANGYAVFANGGYRIQPHLIAKITDSNGKLIEEMAYPRARKDAERVIDGRNAFIMTSMMQDVVQKGTAVKAKSLGRQDIAGKTGTTNDQHDAWFAGFNPKQVAVTWIGFDQPRSLGKDETGGKAALPIWIHYMSTALKGMPDLPYKVPTGVTKIKVSSYSGGRVGEYDEGIYEYFYHETPPKAVYFAPRKLTPLQDPEGIDYYNFPPDYHSPSPLQPQPPPPLTTPPPPPPEAAPDDTGARVSHEPSNQAEPKPDSGNSSAARIMNPSGN